MAKLCSLTTWFVFILSACAVAVPAQQQKALVFRNVDVFDGTKLMRHTDVVVRDGMIRSIGPGVKIPQEAEVIDGQGKTLLPGFFDAHVHLGMVQGERFLRDALNFGVTTELEMWGGEASVALRNKILTEGTTDLADLRTAGTGVTATGGHPTQMGGPPIPTLGPTDDVQKFVDARIAEGADYIKIIYEHAFPTLTVQQLEDVVAAAHKRNKLVVCHISTQREARQAIAAGVDGLVHVFGDSLPDADFASEAAAHHIFVVATLSVLESIAQPPAKAWWADDTKITPYLSSSARGSLERKFPPGLGAKLKFANALAAVAALRRAGVPILAGTDAPAPGLAHGLSVHRELELLVQAGLTPIEALAAATSAPAGAFGFHDRGRIAVGMRADLLLVNGDPTKDISATRDIFGIWKLGVRYTRATDFVKP
jgi:imidazolonepropionase-like amidohydrolase